MKVKRLGFVKKHAKWTIQQWQQVFFSDESTVQQFTTRHRYVHRPTGKRFDEKKHKKHHAEHETSPKRHDLGWNVSERNGQTVLPTTRNDHEWPKVH